MRWRRDRLAGAATDGLMIALVVTSIYLLYQIDRTYTDHSFLFSGWREVLVFVLFVAGVLAGYGPVEDFLYTHLKRGMRPRLTRLHARAETLYEESVGLFDLPPLLARLTEGLLDLTGGSRVTFFLSADEEGVLRQEVGGILSDADGVGAEIPMAGDLGTFLQRARGPVPLPPPAGLVPTGDDGFRRLLLQEGGVVVPLLTAGILTGVAVISPPSRGTLDEEGVEAASVVLDRLSVLIEDARLYAVSRRETLEKDLLFEVGRKISASLDRDELLGLILDGLERVVGFDAGGIFLVDGDSTRISHQIIRGYDEAFLNQVNLKVGKGLVGRAAQLREPILVSDVRERPEYVDARPSTRSEIVLPVFVDSEVIAVINLESDRLRAYRQKDLDLLRVFGSQAGVAIQNARLYREAREKRSLEQELELAGEIQRALLPRRPPTLEGLEIATWFRPSQSVGGDLYDLVTLDRGRLGVAIGDVSGKGTPAAILMASLYASFRSLTRQGLTLSQIMHRLNNLLCENFGSGRYATFFYAVADLQKGELRYCNAGHFPPLFLRPGEEPLPLTEGGIVLGYIPDSDYPAGAVSLQEGDLVVFYTDGLVEAQDPSGEMFGEERVVEVAATLIGRSAQEVLDGLRKSADKHANGVPLGDDMTLVVLRRS